MNLLLFYFHRYIFDQYACDVACKPGSRDRVEFAVKVPVEGGDPVLLPIDAKFPGDLYARLADAQGAGDAEAAAKARKELEARIRQIGRASCRERV